MFVGSPKLFCLNNPILKNPLFPIFFNNDAFERVYGTDLSKITTPTSETSSISSEELPIEGIIVEIKLILNVYGLTLAE